jgi:hypothetical protein
MIHPEKSTASRLRILLSGDAKSGKTKFCQQWPKPFVLNFDNNLDPGYDNWPFHDLSWRRQVCSSGNFRDTCTLAFRQIKDIPTDHTLIWDSVSIAESMFNVQDSLEPIMTKNNVIDTQTMFGRRKTWYENLLVNFNAFAGNSIAIVHTVKEYNKEKEPTGRLGPAISGSMKERLASFFNNHWYTRVDYDSSPPKFELCLQALTTIPLSTSFPTKVDKCPLNYAAVSAILPKKTAQP